MSWDKYFLGLTNMVASNSKCRSKSVGAIIVSDKSIISTGYNGPPAGVPPCDEWPEYRKKFGYRDEFNSSMKRCPRLLSGYKSGQGLEYCPAGHAEANAVNNAARNGVKVCGATMYMNCMIPCKNCLTAIINSGIAEIVVTGYDYYDGLSEYIVKTSGLKVRLYKL